MKIAFCRGGSKVDEKFASFQSLACHRIILHDGPGFKEAFNDLVKGLSSGDQIVVYRFSDAAHTVSDLIDTIIGLHERGAHFFSVQEKFDTSSLGWPTIRKILGSLSEFHRTMTKAEGNGGRPSVGRPRSLSTKAVTEARRLFKSGVSLNDLSSQFKVSRATIYRYLQK